MRYLPAGQGRLKGAFSSVPKERMGTGDQIAKAVVFLASDEWGKSIK